MQKLIPQGQMIIVNPKEIDNHTTEGGLEIFQFQLQAGEVMEVSNDLSSVYKKGDVVLFPKQSGIGILYDKKSCLFLNGSGYPLGEVVCIVDEKL